MFVVGETEFDLLSGHVGFAMLVVRSIITLEILG